MKKFNLITTILLAAILGHGQTWQFLSYPQPANPTNNTGEGNDVLEDSDGLYVVAGWSKPNGVNDRQFTMFKYDDQGQSLGATIYNLSPLVSAGEAHAIAEITDPSNGGYVIAGGTCTGPICNTNENRMLVRTDYSGNVLWSRKTIYETMLDVKYDPVQSRIWAYGFGVLTASDHDYHVFSTLQGTGSPIYGNFDFNNDFDHPRDFMLNNSLGQVAMVGESFNSLVGTTWRLSFVITDQNLAIQSSGLLEPATYPHTLHGGAIAFNGTNYVVAGEYKVPNSGGSICLVMIDPSTGSVVGKVKYDDPVTDAEYEVRDMLITSNHYIICGYRNDHSNAKYDGFVHVVDKNRIVNSTTYLYGDDGQFETGLNSITETTDGYLLFTGTATIGVQPHQNVWMLKTEMNGYNECNETVVLSANQFGIVESGAATARTPIQAASEHTSGSWIAVHEYEACNWQEKRSITTVEDINELNGKVKAYPNPADDQLYIEVDDYTLKSTINITDALGKLVHSSRLTENRIAIDVSEFSSGTYLISVKNNNGIQTKRILIK